MITFDFENKEIRQDGRKIGEISAIDSRAESDILNEIQNQKAIRFLIFAMMFCMEMNMMSSGII